MRERTEDPARRPPRPEPRARTAARRLGGLALLLVLPVLAGCGATRVLVIDSTPSGARLFVNGEDVGTTPHRISYVHEGRFEVRLEKPGYESIADEIVTRTGADATPGPDFFLENFSGGRVVRTTERRFALAPLKGESYTKEEMEAVLRKATLFRDRAGREVAEPGSPTPTRPPEPTPPAKGPATPGR